MISIIPYQEQYQPDFKRLNLHWLDHYDLTESHDLEILDDPKGKVLDGGGAIFLAMDGERVVGTAGIARDNNEVYELVKMAVDPQYHGRGISKELLNECLQLARLKGAKKIYLWSNSQLTTALKLYEKNGFRHVVPENSPLLTADVKMELNL
jgi:GNAT superfamily N-acetyltransferase